MSAKELPEDLVIQILLRLPVIALLRFRCVRKSWCSLISSHDFITKHLNQSSLNEDTHHLLVHHRGKITKNCLLNMLSFQTLDVLKTLPVPFIDIDRKIWNINILASCNGVICLDGNWGRDTVLWNPTTRQTKIVPKSLPLPPGTKSNGNYRGFGFDAKTNDYKVVKFSEYHDRDNLFHDYQVQVYSLRSDSWRKIDASVPAIIGYKFWGWGKLYTNGMFSWWAVGFTDCETLVSFDMSNEVFLTTPLPDANLIKPCTDENRHYINFFVRDESVALVVCIDDDDEGNVTHFDIWVLHEYGVKESWTKLLTIGPFPGINCALGFWKNGHLFLRTSEGQLVLYDPISKNIKYLQIDGIPETIQLTTYMESLVSIKGGN